MSEIVQNVPVGSALDDAADVVIIGTGAGGATAARVLSEAGLDVILVEEGPFIPKEQRRLDAFGAFKGMWRDAGFQVAQGRAVTPVLQGCAVGGSTVINGAIIHRLPASIHAAWDREHSVARGLPYEALTRAFDTMDAELHVAPAPESVLGGNNQTMRRGLTQLGIDGHAIRRNVHDCQGSARCNQGCPTARKQSMDESYVPWAMRRGARVYATCRADQVLSKAGRATGVSARFKSGARLSLTARHAVIVAAGAVHTPLMLLRSGLRAPLIGKRFQAHPATSVLGLFDEPIDMWRGVTQGFETLAFWHEKMKFETASVPLEILAARLPGFGAELMDLLASSRHIAQWGVEVRASAQGQVHAGPFGDAPFIRYDLSDDDVRLVKLGISRLCQMMFAAGAREVMPGVHGLPARIRSLDEVARIEALPNDPRLFHCITGHVFGTAAMGPTPANSVVDLDGQSHELRGLYVLDASNFPSNIGVNPQHSIAAVSWLLAERLAERAQKAKARSHT